MSDFDIDQAIKELANSVARIEDSFLPVAERAVASHERLAAAMESIAAQMPALIEASKSRGYGGGGNWKRGADRGIFRTPPPPVSFEPNDTYRVPVGSYALTDYQGAKSLTFFGLFEKDGSVADEGKGVKVGSLKLESKTYKESFAAWKHATDNLRHVLPSPFFVVFKVAKGKDDKPNFAYISGKEKFPAEGTEIAYNELPEAVKPPAKES